MYILNILWLHINAITDDSALSIQFNTTKYRVVNNYLKKNTCNNLTRADFGIYTLTILIIYHYIDCFNLYFITYLNHNTHSKKHALFNLEGKKIICTWLPTVSRALYAVNYI